jgi:hypothetical protein
MRILYVAARPLEINTSASIRNRATIQGMLQLGHQVDLITTQPDINHNNYDNSIDIKQLNTIYIRLEGIQSIAKVTRKYKLLQPIKVFLYKIISKYTIYDNLKGVANKIYDININEKKYDFVISSSDPKSSHLLVYKMYENKILTQIPWIQIWGDPFLSDITRTSKLLNKIIMREENRLLSLASRIIYVSKLTLKEQKLLFPLQAKKMVSKPIPYLEIKQYQPIDLKKSSLKFLYTGDYFSNVRDITQLYKALEGTAHQLIICGNSDLELKNTDNIKVYPRLNFKEIKNFEYECDVLVHLSNLNGSQIPGKVYQYCGTNKPILFLLDGNKKEIFNEFNRYNRFIFADNDKNSIIETICSIYKGYYDNISYIINEYDPEVVAAQIISLAKEREYA